MSDIILHNEIRGLASENIGEFYEEISLDGAYFHGDMIIEFQESARHSVDGERYVESVESAEIIGLQLSNCEAVLTRNFFVNLMGEKAVREMEAEYAEQREVN